MNNYEPNPDICPDCGSGAYSRNVCSSCGRMPPKVVRFKPPEPCKRHRWDVGQLVTVNAQKQEWSQCSRCGERRYVEIDPR